MNNPQKKIKILNPLDPWEPIRFIYENKTYETEEPYFIVKEMAKENKKGLENFLILSLINGIVKKDLKLK